MNDSQMVNQLNVKGRGLPFLSFFTSHDPEGRWPYFVPMSIVMAWVAVSITWLLYDLCLFHSLELALLGTASCLGGAFVRGSRRNGLWLSTIFLCLFCLTYYHVGNISSPLIALGPVMRTNQGLRIATALALVIPGIAINAIYIYIRNKIMTIVAAALLVGGIELFWLGNVLWYLSSLPSSPYGVPPKIPEYIIVSVMYLVPIFMLGTLGRILWVRELYMKGSLIWRLVAVCCTIYLSAAFVNSISRSEDGRWRELYYRSVSYNVADLLRGAVANGRPGVLTDEYFGLFDEKVLGGCDIDASWIPIDMDNRARQEEIHIQLYAYRDKGADFTLLAGAPMTCYSDGNGCFLLLAVGKNGRREIELMECRQLLDRYKATTTLEQFMYSNLVEHSLGDDCVWFIPIVADENSREAKEEMKSKYHRQTDQ